MESSQNCKTVQGIRRCPKSVSIAVKSRWTTITIDFMDSFQKYRIVRGIHRCLRTFFLSTFVTILKIREDRSQSCRLVQGIRWCPRNLFLPNATFLVRIVCRAVMVLKTLLNIIVFIAVKNRSFNFVINSEGITMNNSP